MFSVEAKKEPVIHDCINLLLSTKSLLKPFWLSQRQSKKRPVDESSPVNGSRIGLLI